MLEQMKERVWRANLQLKESGLVVLTWGNVSEIDRATGYIVIKPSGVDYGAMKPEDMVVVDGNGQVTEGKLRPSSDLATHLEIYRVFPDVGGITHTHSRWATVFAQAGAAIPPLGTTHADTFCGAVPVTRKLTAEEIAGAYEKETGTVIVEAFRALDPMAVPGVLVHSHGPFTWGKDAAHAVENAVILEEVAMMAWHTLRMAPQSALQQELLDKHYSRKHGKNAYYGQKG